MLSLETSPTPCASASEAQLQQMAENLRENPGAEVRLFGSHARGQARPDSVIDLLITVTDDWLRHHNRFEVLDRLRWRLSQPPRPVDLLLFPPSLPGGSLLVSALVQFSMTADRR